MTLQQLHYVITIAETGSFSRAAEILYVAQPSLSAAIQALEKEVGISIFYRSGKGATLTNDGAEFLMHARQVYHQYDALKEKYGNPQNVKKKFGVSAQHYSFAVKAFVELLQTTDTSKYEFAIRETKTRDVIDDVGTMKSEIGILYLSDFNRPVIQKILKTNNLEFHKLIDCRAYVYLRRGHPLAAHKSISFSELSEYPCLSFEQGEHGSFYFAEEILSTNEYPRIIKVCDRATVLNLMVGLDGYILCSGIICEELNGPDYVAVPFEDPASIDCNMEIGYIVKKENKLSHMAELYIARLQAYLDAAAGK